MDNSAPNQCPVFIITLDHAHKRRELISSRLTDLGLSFQFRSGVDGRKLNLLKHPNYAPEKRRLFFGRDLSSGEFGCVLAHREIYRHMAESKIPRALILEDDALLTDELPAVLEALEQRAESWDMVRFLGRPKNYCAMRPIIELGDTGTNLSRTRGIPGGAYGYILNLRAAERLFSMSEKSWLAIDTLHGVCWLTKLETLSVMPSPVLPNDEVPSCIDELDNNARWDKRVQLPTWARAIYPLTRGGWKFYLNFMIACTWLYSKRKDYKLQKRLI